MVTAITSKAVNPRVFETCRTTLHAAAFGDHTECLQLLLRHDAQVNAVDHSGKTALMMAAENGQAGAVGTYLGCGLCTGAGPKCGIESDKDISAVLAWPPEMGHL